MDVRRGTSWPQYMSLSYHSFLSTEPVMSLRVFHQLSHRANGDCSFVQQIHWAVFTSVDKTSRSNRQNERHLQKLSPGRHIHCSLEFYPGFIPTLHMFTWNLRNMDFRTLVHIILTVFRLHVVCVQLFLSHHLSYYVPHQQRMFKNLGKVFTCHKFHISEYSR